MTINIKNITKHLLNNKFKYFIISIIIIFLDYNNIFTSLNINVNNYIIIAGTISTVFGTWFFTRMENLQEKRKQFIIFKQELIDYEDSIYAAIHILDIWHTRYNDALIRACNDKSKLSQNDFAYWDNNCQKISALIEPIHIKIKKQPRIYGKYNSKLDEFEYLVSIKNYTEENPKKYSKQLFDFLKLLHEEKED